MAIGQQLRVCSKVPLPLWQRVQAGVSTLGEEVGRTQLHVVDYLDQEFIGVIISIGVQLSTAQSVWPCALQFVPISSSPVLTASSQSPTHCRSTVYCRFCAHHHPLLLHFLHFCLVLTSIPAWATVRSLYSRYCRSSLAQNTGNRRSRLLMGNFSLFLSPLRATLRLVAVLAPSENGNPHLIID